MRDPMRRRLGTRIGELHVLAHGEAEGARQRRFERREIDLAIALHAVAVAGREQATVGEDREINCGADPKVLVVDVTAEGARFDRAALTPFGRRRHAHDAEERLELDLGAPGHGADAAVGIDRNVGQAVKGEVFRQRAHQRSLHVPAPVGAELDVEHLDRQHVAALRAFDMHRAGQDVPPDMRLQLGQDLAVLGQDVEGLTGQDLGGSGHAVNRGDVARLDAQLRCELAVEIAPVAGVRRRMKLVRGHFGPPQSCDG